MSWATDQARAQDNYTALLTRMGGLCAIWRRPTNNAGVQSGAYQRIKQNVPFSVSATGKLLFQKNPNVATYAGAGEEGTNQDRIIELPVKLSGVAVDVQRADVLVGPDGSQYYVNDLSTDETAPLSLILRVQKTDLGLHLVP